MPLYEFENEQHGVRVQLRMTVADRPDAIVLKRRTVPSHVTVGVGAKAPNTSDHLRSGYKQLEERGQLAVQGRDYLDVKTIKRAIEMPDTD